MADTGPLPEKGGESMVSASLNFSYTSTIRFINDLFS